MCLISIIIPVYNVEKYLERCVLSIVQQDFEDYEIILINDGSKDSSYEICCNLSLKFSNIITLNKLNGGASSARNEGIKLAKGLFLMFLDSDDYWEKSNSMLTIKDNIEKNPEIDVVFYGHKIYNVHNGKTSQITHYKAEDSDFLKNNSKNDVLEYLFKNNLFPTAAWRTVVRRDLVIQNNLFFIEGLIAEDIDWQIALFLKAQQFDCIPDVFYVYSLGRVDSISNTSGKKGVESILYILDKCVMVFEHKSDILSSKFLSFLSYHYSVVFITYAYLDKKDKELYRERLQGYMRLFKNLSSFKTNIVYCLLKVFGLNYGSVLVRSFHKVYRKRK